jgi:hypothetical protein
MSPPRPADPRDPRACDQEGSRRRRCREGAALTAPSSRCSTRCSSLPVGRLSDGWVRTRLLAISLTVLVRRHRAGGADHQLCHARRARASASGIGEAATSPAGTSLLYDLPAPAAARVRHGGHGLGHRAGPWRLADPRRPRGAVVGWRPIRARRSRAGSSRFSSRRRPAFVLAAFLWRLREPERGADGRHRHAAASRALRPRGLSRCWAR